MKSYVIVPLLSLALLSSKALLVAGEMEDPSRRFADTLPIAFSESEDDGQVGKVYTVLRDALIHNERDDRMNVADLIENVIQNMTPGQVRQLLLYSARAGYTLLQWAVRRDDIDAVKALFRAARRVRMSNEEISELLTHADATGYTALMEAVQKAPGLIHILLDNARRHMNESDILAMIDQKSDLLDASALDLAQHNASAKADLTLFIRNHLSGSRRVPGE